jgi:hypothetical protein
MDSGLDPSIAWQLCVCRLFLQGIFVICIEFVSGGMTDHIHELTVQIHLPVAQL